MGVQQLLGEGCVHGEREREAVSASPPQSHGRDSRGSLAKLGASAVREIGVFDSRMSLSHLTSCPTSVLPEQRRRTLEKMKRGLQ